jgi:hypothetical protein
MQQKATKYASSGNNVLLKYVVQLFFPGKSCMSLFNFSIFVPDFHSYRCASTTVEFFFWEAMRWIKHIYPDTSEV